MTGERPAHLDRCDICAERAVDLGRWLDDVRTTGLAEADAVFPAEQLAAQHTQILRRLEQLDRPARVLAFPGQTRYERFDLAPQGIRPAWVGVAAAAGLVLGLLGGQIPGRLSAQNVPRPSEQVQQAPSTAALTESSGDLAPLLELDEVDRTQTALATFDANTPHIVPASEQVLRTDRNHK